MDLRRVDLDPIDAAPVEVLRLHELERELDVGMRAAAGGPRLEAQLLDEEAATKILEQRSRIVVAGRIQPVEAVTPFERSLEAFNARPREQRR